MKLSNQLKVLLGGAILAASVGAQADTYNPSDMVLTLSNNGPQINYFTSAAGLDSLNLYGSVAGDGFDRWKIDLTTSGNFVVNGTTGQDTTLPYAVLTGATLRDSAFNALTSVSASALGGLSGLSLISGNLIAGTYYLDIFGDAGLGYSGSISAVPLPAAAWLFGSALLGMGALRRKQKQDLAVA